MQQPRSKKASSLVASLEKAMTVLDLLSAVDGDIELAKLAEKAQLPKSTLVRLLNTLRAHSFVQQNPQTRRYRLGWALIHLGKAAERQFELSLVVHPFLEQLMQETGETASLAVLDFDHAVYVDQVVSRSIIKGVPHIGSRLELHCTAVGKVLSSAFSDDRLDELIREYGLPRLTENTIVNATQFRKEISLTRARGYGFDNEEAEPGGRCIAAPIVDGSSDVIGAISITGPTNRMQLERVEEFAEIVRRIACQASRALGQKAQTAT